MTDPSDTEYRNLASTSPASGQRVVNSAELFGAETEIVLLHNGTPYRLRITRQDKLILTK